MNLHELKSNIPNKGKKRIGRGGKRGTYSGRGQKGQHARAGRKLRPAMRDVLIRTPKKRGYANKRKSVSAFALPAHILDKIVADKINLKTLVENKLVRSTIKEVKIVAGKEIKNKLNIEGLKVTVGAKKQIEKAGGSVA